MTASTAPALGLRANLGQFVVLVAVNALVGGVLGQERAVLPVLAEEEFEVGTYSAAMTFVLAFGLAKAVTNLVAGAVADRAGRRSVLITGWALALPVPLMILAATSWWVVVAANVLLGVSQGLTWSMTMTMKVDLVGPRRRGLALGANESAGYLAVALTAVLTGHLAAEHGLRPWPFVVGLAYAGLGLALSALVVRETHDHAHAEADAMPAGAASAGGGPPGGSAFRATTYGDPVLGSACQAGLVNNLNDGLAWGAFPLLFAGAGLPLGQVGLLLAIYPGVWGLGQVAAGALADLADRRVLVATGMLLQAAALGWIAAARDFGHWAVASALLGAGTALVYPTLLAVVSDGSGPRWRARALGVYRLWRDLGFAVGAVVVGVVADLAGIRAAVAVVALLTAVSGLHAARFMTSRVPSGAHPARRRFR